MNKLGVSFNIFNSKETLYEVVKSYREVVDHVSIVFQFISNHGNPCDEETMKIIERLKQEGIVDDLISYEPNFALKPKENETVKRNIGLDLARKVGCTHFITADGDEFYIKEEFLKARDIVYENNYDSSYCPIRSYYKTPAYYYDEDFYVPFIYKINDRVFDRANGVVAVDPSRKMKPNRLIKFNPNIIKMHHLNYVRENLNEKLTNASSNNNYGHKLTRMVDHHNKWKYPDKALILFHAFQLKQVEVKQTEPLIKLSYFKTQLDEAYEDLLPQPIQSMPNENKIDLSIVIISDAKDVYHLELTKSAINSIIKNSDPNIKKEIIIVENNKDVKYENTITIYQEGEFNYNKYLNFGTSHSSGEYIAFCNNDLWFHKYWDQKLLETMKRKKIGSASPLSTFKCGHASIYAKTDGVRPGYSIGQQFLGWCFVLHRGVYDKIKGLDETYTFWRSDQAVIDQLIKNNIRHYIICSSVVDHVNNGNNTLKTLGNKTKEEFTTKQRNLYKQTKKRR